MQTFADLLTAYMDRTGIGDAELARRIPVSRPTLLRWKEGVTARPRYREDIVRCAEILRLTDDETDELLLAAGFSPDTAPAPTDPPEPDRTPAGPELSPDETAPGLFRQRFWITGVAAPLLVIAVVAAVVALRARDSTVYPTAVGDESLIVLAPFVNYTAGGQGFNVVGRLRSAIDAEVREAQLASVRTVEWPREIESESAAEDAGRRADAALVIWGEYDSGRVIARFTAPRSRQSLHAQQIVDIASSPAELPATINLGLTDEVRHVALLTLGQLYLEQDEFDRAKTVLVRAMDPPPSEHAALANLRFLLGRAFMGGDLADYDEAVWLFTQVLAVRSKSVEGPETAGRSPTWLGPGRATPIWRCPDLLRADTIDPERTATNLNLAVAYLERDVSGDADRALGSLNEALDIDPEYASAYVNRAWAYVARGGPGDVDRAFDDIEEALDIEPELASAYHTRGKRVPRPWRTGRRRAGHRRVQPRDRVGPRLAGGLLQPRPGRIRKLKDWSAVAGRSASRPRPGPATARLQQHAVPATRGNGQPRRRRCHTATRRWPPTRESSPRTAVGWRTPCWATTTRLLPTSRHFSPGSAAPLRRAAGPTTARAVRRGSMR